MAPQREVARPLTPPEDGPGEKQSAPHQLIQPGALTSMTPPASRSSSPSPDLGKARTMSSRKTCRVSPKNLQNDHAEIDWSSAVKLYQEEWTTIEDDSKQQLKPERIPWPVKSRHMKDVNVENVKEFFQHSFQGSSRFEARKRAEREKRRWDKEAILSALTDARVTRNLHKLVELVSQVAQSLWGGHRTLNQ